MLWYNYERNNMAKNGCDPFTFPQHSGKHSSIRPPGAPSRRPSRSVAMVIRFVARFTPSPLLPMVTFRCHRVAPPQNGTTFPHGQNTWKLILKTAEWKIGKRSSAGASSRFATLCCSHFRPSQFLGGGRSNEGSAGRGRFCSRDNCRTERI